MIIDYIYLVLIIVLIGAILFLIYLSHEYRINEGFIVKINFPQKTQPKMPRSRPNDLPTHSLHGAR